MYTIFLHSIHMSIHSFYKIIIMENEERERAQEQHIAKKWQLNNQPKSLHKIYTDINAIYV